MPVQGDTGPVSLVVLLLAYPRLMHCHRAGRRYGVVAPHRVEQLVAGDGGPAVLDEVPQKMELLGRELQGDAVALDLRPSKVDADGAETIGIGRSDGAGPATQPGLDPSQELRHVARLG